MNLQKYYESMTKQASIIKLSEEERDYFGRIMAQGFMEKLGSMSKNSHISKIALSKTKAWLNKLMSQSAKRAGTTPKLFTDAGEKASKAVREFNKRNPVLTSSSKAPSAAPTKGTTTTVSGTGKPKSSGTSSTSSKVDINQSRGPVKDMTAKGDSLGEALARARSVEYVGGRTGKLREWARNTGRELKGAMKGGKGAPAAASAKKGPRAEFAGAGSTSSPGSKSSPAPGTTSGSPPPKKSPTIESPPPAETASKMYPEVNPKALTRWKRYAGMGLAGGAGGYILANSGGGGGGRSQYPSRGYY